MDTEEIETSKESVDVSSAYLIFTFSVGITLAVALTYLGFIGYSFWVVIAVGGLAQVAFRISKRAWSNSLNPAYAEEKRHKNLLISAAIDTLPTVTIFMSLYVVMVLVSAFWYGVGALFSWLFS